MRGSFDVEVNGKQILATSAGVDAVLSHVQQIAVGKDPCIKMVEASAQAGSNTTNTVTSNKMHAVAAAQQQ